ncbi:MAG: hypothetical protein WAqTSA_40590 [Shewanella algae]
MICRKGINEPFNQVTNPKIKNSAPTIVIGIKLLLEAASAGVATVMFINLLLIVIYCLATKFIGAPSILSGV